ncbi:MAG: sigma-54-dependent Fis family transcriptional regulator, partial [Firmicutes bacterium]|nr:sigma-54-dependent Fis family transcriptional regulator [Bacillota bacterium]
LQSKLLRALENREIRRVGGVKNIPIDVRIICATNVNLENMVAEKQFREDLFYRLSVFVIQLPPLYERKEDIIPLAENFLYSLNEKYDTHKTLAPVSIETMMNHRWPGNIRELRNVMERIFVVSPGDELIFTPTPTAGYAREVLETGAFHGMDVARDLKEFVTLAERWYIDKTLEQCGGRMGEAAEKLGIHRSALYRKLHKEV